MSQFGTQSNNPPWARSNGNLSCFYLFPGTEYYFGYFIIRPTPWPSTAASALAYGAAHNDEPASQFPATASLPAVPSKYPATAATTTPTTTGLIAHYTSTCFFNFHDKTRSILQTNQYSIFSLLKLFWASKFSLGTNPRGIPCPTLSKRHSWETWLGVLLLLDSSLYTPCPLHLRFR